VRQVHLRCLDKSTIREFSIETFDGQNWEEAMEKEKQALEGKAQKDE
jgi:hypothetical protein